MWIISESNHQTSEKNKPLFGRKFSKYNAEQEDHFNANSRAFITDTRDLKYLLMNGAPNHSFYYWQTLDIFIMAVSASF